MKNSPRSIAMLLPLALGALGLAGCDLLADSQTCIDQCNTARACPDVNEDEPVTCSEACSAVAGLATAAGCPEAPGAVYDCVGAQPDICAMTGEECQAEAEAVRSCAEAYCAQETAPAECTEAAGWQSQG